MSDQSKKRSPSEDSNSLNPSKRSKVEDGNRKTHKRNVDGARSHDKASSSKESNLIKKKKIKTSAATTKSEYEVEDTGWCTTSEFTAGGNKSQDPQKDCEEVMGLLSEISKSSKPGQAIKSDLFAQNRQLGDTASTISKSDLALLSSNTGKDNEGSGTSFGSPSGSISSPALVISTTPPKKSGSKKRKAQGAGSSQGKRKAPRTPDRSAKLLKIATRQLTHRTPTKGGYSSRKNRTPQKSSSKDKSPKKSINLKKGKKRKKIVQRKDKSSDSEEEEDDDEGEESSEYELDFDSELEARLEENAARNNLSAINVKSILHHVITNEHVLAMVRNTMQDIEEPKKPGTPEKAPAVYEPKLTRSKLKEVTEKVGSSAVAWPLTPVKKSHQPVPQFAEIDFPEDSSEDEDYKPSQEEMTQVDESDYESVTSQSNFGSPCPPGTPRSLNVSFEADTETSPSRTTSATTPTTSKAHPKHIPAAAVPMGPPLSRPRHDFDDMKFLTQLDSFDAELKVIQENIGNRTRSKHPINQTVEELEASFIPPDIAHDMYDSDPEDKDDEWVAWLAGLNQPPGGPESVDPPDDDQNDPEYNFLAEEETVDTEDFRDDKAVRVSRKELDELMDELMEAYGNEVDLQQAAQSLVPGPFNQPVTLSAMIAQQREAAASGDSTSPVLGSTAEARLEKDKDDKDGNSDYIQMTDHERQQLQQQMQQHVQQLCQLSVMTRACDTMLREHNQAKKFLNELNFLAGSFEQAVFGVSAETSAQPLPYCSFFRTCNLKEACQIAERPLPEREPENENTIRLQRQVCIPLPAADTFATSTVFMYPELLPITRLGHTKKKLMFTDSEDNLIVYGLDQFRHFETLEEKMKLIQEMMLPTKTVKQLCLHCKNMMSNRSGDNVIKLYRKYGVISHPIKPCEPIAPGMGVAPAELYENRKPDWLKKYMQLVTLRTTSERLIESPDNDTTKKSSFRNLKPSQTEMEFTDSDSQGTQSGKLIVHKMPRPPKKIDLKKKKKKKKVIPLYPKGVPLAVTSNKATAQTDVEMVTEGVSQPVGSQGTAQPEKDGRKSESNTTQQQVKQSDVTNQRQPAVPVQNTVVIAPSGIITRPSRAVPLQQPMLIAVNPQAGAGFQNRLPVSSQGAVSLPTSTKPMQLVTTYQQVAPQPVIRFQQPTLVIAAPQTSVAGSSIIIQSQPIMTTGQISPNNTIRIVGGNSTTNTAKTVEQLGPQPVRIKPKPKMARSSSEETKSSSDDSLSKAGSDGSLDSKTLPKKSSKKISKQSEDVSKVDAPGEQESDKSRHQIDSTGVQKSTNKPGIDAAVVQAETNTPKNDPSSVQKEINSSRIDSADVQKEIDRPRINSSDAQEEMDKAKKLLEVVRQRISSGEEEKAKKGRGIKKKKSEKEGKKTKRAKKKRDGKATEEEVEKMVKDIKVQLETSRSDKEKQSSSSGSGSSDKGSDNGDDMMDTSGYFPDLSPSPKMTEGVNKNEEQICDNKEDSAKSSVDKVKSSVDHVKSSVDHVKSSVDHVRSSVDPIESSVDLVKSSDDQVKSSVDHVKSSDDHVKSSVDPIESSVDLVKTSVFSITSPPPGGANTPLTRRVLFREDSKEVGKSCTELKQVHGATDVVSDNHGEDDKLEVANIDDSPSVASHASSEWANMIESQADAIDTKILEEDHMEQSQSPKTSEGQDTVLPGQQRQDSLHKGTVKDTLLQDLGSFAVIQIQAGQTTSPPVHVRLDQVKTPTLLESPNPNEGQSVTTQNPRITFHSPPVSSFPTQVSPKDVTNTPSPLSHFDSSKSPKGISALRRFKIGKGAMARQSPVTPQTQKSKTARNLLEGRSSPSDQVVMMARKSPVIQQSPVTQSHVAQQNPVTPQTHISKTALNSPGQNSHLDQVDRTMQATSTDNQKLVHISPTVSFSDVAPKSQSPHQDVGDNLKSFSDVAPKSQSPHHDVGDNLETNCPGANQEESKSAEEIIVDKTATSPSDILICKEPVLSDDDEEDELKPLAKEEEEFCKEEPMDADREEAEEEMDVDKEPIENIPEDKVDKDIEIKAEQVEVTSESPIVDTKANDQLVSPTASEKSFHSNVCTPPSNREQDVCTPPSSRPNSTEPNVCTPPSDKLSSSAEPSPTLKDVIGDDEPDSPETEDALTSPETKIKKDDDRRPSVTFEDSNSIDTFHHDSNSNTFDGFEEGHDGLDAENEDSNPQLPEGKRSRRSKKMAAKKIKTKLRRDMESTVEMLDPNIISNDPLREERDESFSKAYLKSVKEALKGDLPKYIEFLKVLNDFTDEKEPDMIGLYHNVCKVLEGYSDLIEEFTAFLPQEVASQCGVLIPNLEFAKARLFLRQVEVYFRKQPTHFQKILSLIIEWGGKEERTNQQLKDVILPQLKSQPHLKQEFSLLFPDNIPPESHMMDFEYITLGDDDHMEYDSFEEIEVSDSEEEKPPRVIPINLKKPGSRKKLKKKGDKIDPWKGLNAELQYGTHSCKCNCHEKSLDLRVKRKGRHCAYCTAGVSRAELISSLKGLKAPTRRQDGDSIGDKKRRAKDHLRKRTNDGSEDDDMDDEDDYDEEEDDDEDDGRRGRHGRRKCSEAVSHLSQMCASLADTLNENINTSDDEDEDDMDDDDDDDLEKYTEDEDDLDDDDDDDKETEDDDEKETDDDKESCDDKDTDDDHDYDEEELDYEEDNDDLDLDDGIETGEDAEDEDDDEEDDYDEEDEEDGKDIKEEVASLSGKEGDDASNSPKSLNKGIKNSDGSRSSSPILDKEQQETETDAKSDQIGKKENDFSSKEVTSSDASSKVQVVPSSDGVKSKIQVVPPSDVQSKVKIESTKEKNNSTEGNSIVAEGIRISKDNEKQTCEVSERTQLNQSIEQLSSESSTLEHGAKKSVQKEQTCKKLDSKEPVDTQKEVISICAKKSETIIDQNVDWTTLEVTASVDQSEKSDTKKDDVSDGGGKNSGGKVKAGFSLDKQAETEMQQSAKVRAGSSEEDHGVEDNSAKVKAGSSEEDRGAEDNSGKVKDGSSLDEQTETETKSAKVRAGSPSEDRGVGDNSDKVKAGSSSDEQIRTKTQNVKVTWTRDDDRLLLQSCQEKDPTDALFAEVAKKLGEKTVQQVSERFKMLMQIFNSSQEEEEDDDEEDDESDDYDEEDHGDGDDEDDSMEEGDD